MEYKIVLLPKAIDDLNASIDWCISIYRNLAEQFVLEVENAFQLISKNPFLFQTSHADYKMVNTQRFPFKIVYKVITSDIIIIAVFHHKRDPKKIIKRIK